MVRDPIASRSLELFGEVLGSTEEIGVLVQKTLSHNSHDLLLSLPFYIQKLISVHFYDVSFSVT